eukprot:12769225-Ditylum_brightwellii.AAC.1
MTNYGYTLPDPRIPNRLSVWFTGGTIEVNDEEYDIEEWRRIFASSLEKSAKSTTSAATVDDIETTASLPSSSSPTSTNLP